jgi:hypothetical protein
MKIKWSNRFKGEKAPNTQRATCVVDGTDFPIKEVRRNGFDSGWFSHKFNGPAVKYEVATSIRGGDIVWFHGPFPGSHNDLTIFRRGLRQMLHQLEWIWGDRGYRGDSKVITPYDIRVEAREELALARARHEIFNGRFKRFSILNNVYRHSIHKHNLVFASVVIIIQLETECGFCIPFPCDSMMDPAFTPDDP